MSAYATKLAEAFASKATQRFYQTSVAEAITNQDFEGEIKDKASKLNILTFDEIALKDYVGSALSADDIGESNGQLVTDQQKAYYFKIKSLDVFKSYIKNPEGTLLDNAAKQLKRAVDAYVLGLHGDVAAGSRQGTDYATGTVAVANSTGVVTGSGTTFTAAMVGKPFTCDGLEDADGNPVWYRVKARNSNTEIVIEDDKDDVTSAYTGGAISAGASYKIQAATAVQVTKDTIYGKLVDLKTILDKKEVPAEDRWCVMPADMVNLLVQATGINPAQSEAYDEVTKRGYINMFAGFKVYSNEQVSGNATDGYHVLAGHKSAITMAMGFTESGIEDLVGDFGQAYKGLSVYGAKVIDERRKALAEGFWKL